MNWTKQKPDFACIFLTKDKKYKDGYDYDLWHLRWIQGEPPEDAPEDIHENTRYYYLGWFTNDGDEWDDIGECDFEEYLILEKLPTLEELK